MITQPYKIPTRLIAAAFECASNDQSKHYLMGVLLVLTEKSDGLTWQTFGANGHIMCRAETVASHGGEAGTALYFSPNDCMTMAAHAKLDKKGMGWATAIPSEGDTYVTILDRLIMRYEDCDFQYPDVKRILPDEWEPMAPPDGLGAVSVGLNTGYLARINKIAKWAAHPKAASVKMHVQGRNMEAEPLHFDMQRVCDDGYIKEHVVLMPMRL